MTRIPRWGLVSAAPHEYLIHIRRGGVKRHEQGGSCFRWPGDSVALVDTSVHRLKFTADQVTREKTGVAVTGLAVLRVARPLIAYRMLNLDDPLAWQETLCEMFVGATRRLVANLSLQECLTRRKDALAAELMREIAPIVQGSGRVEDTTDQGWGVAIDTIEVQDVRVLSKEVFVRLQAPYREALAMDALKARSTVEAEDARIRGEQAREAEQHRREMLALEEARVQAEQERAQRAADHAAKLAMVEAEALLQRRARQAAEELRTAEARAASDRRQAEALAESKRVQAVAHAAAEREIGLARVEVLRAERALSETVSEARLRELMLTETLPRVAEAYRGAFDHITVHTSDLGVLGQGLTQVFSLLERYSGWSKPTQEDDS